MKSVWYKYVFKDGTVEYTKGKMDKTSLSWAVIHHGPIVSLTRE